MPLGGNITVFGSASASPWHQMDMYAGAVTMRAVSVGTCKGHVEGTLVNVGVLGTAAASASTIFVLPAFSSVSAASTAAATAVTTTYDGPPCVAFRVVVTAGTTASSVGIRFSWTQALEP